MQSKLDACRTELRNERDKLLAMDSETAGQVSTATAAYLIWASGLDLLAVPLGFVACFGSRN